MQAGVAVAPLLAEKYHVLALDWPGFGGSDPLASPDDYTSRRFAEFIVDFMDSLSIRQASLVATDIALLPALLVGLEHPSRVSKLAVMDGIPFPRPQYSSWELKSFAKKGSILGKALVRWFPRVTAQISYLKGFYRGHSIPAEVRQEFLADGMSKSNQEAFLSYFQNFRMGQEYFEPRAHELQTPVLVVWGKYDRFISSKLGYEIAEKLPNAKLEVIDRALQNYCVDGVCHVLRSRSQQQIVFGRVQLPLPAGRNTLDKKASLAVGLEHGALHHGQDAQKDLFQLPRQTIH